MTTCFHGSDAECDSQDSDICRTGRTDQCVPQGYQALVAGAPFTEHGVVSFLNVTLAFKPGCVNFLHGIYFQVWRRNTNSSSVWRRVNQQYFRVDPVHFLVPSLTLDRFVLHSDAAQLEQLEFYPNDVLGYYVIVDFSLLVEGYTCSLSVVLVRSWTPSNMDVYGVLSGRPLETMSIVDPPMFPGVFPAISVHYVTLPNATITRVTLGQCPTNSTAAASIVTTPTSLQYVTPSPSPISFTSSPSPAPPSSISFTSSPSPAPPSSISFTSSPSPAPSSTITFPLPDVPPGTLQGTKLNVIIYSIGGIPCVFLVMVIIASVTIVCRRRRKRPRRLTSAANVGIENQKEDASQDGDIYALPNLRNTRHQDNVDTSNEEASSPDHMYEVISDIRSDEARLNTDMYEPVDCNLIQHSQ
ncbi:hypothetical protein EMCRGX_G019354 [Ephydatia muelleri]